MKYKLELTEAEAQYLRDILLDQIKLARGFLGGDKAEKYLKSIGKGHAFNVYKKLT